MSKKGVPDYYYFFNIYLLFWLCWVLAVGHTTFAAALKHLVVAQGI